VSEERGPEEPSAPPTKVPTAFGSELTLGAGGTEALTFQPDQDVLLSGLSAKADGPTLIEFEVTDAPRSGVPILSTPAGTFPEYLEHEYPVHLAASAGEEPAQWLEKNRRLTEAAHAGDDEAFFALLARDPRQLASELTLRRVVTWRTEIDEYNRVFRFKASRFLLPAAAAADARHRMEAAQKKLGLLGTSQLDLYDQRGKRPLPPAQVARGFYYGLLCLFQGLRTVCLERAKANVRPRQTETEVSALVDGLADLQGESPFLPYIRLAVRLLRDQEILTQAGFANLTLVELVGTRDATPSDTARIITAAALEVSEDTIERLAAQPVPLPLPSVGTRQRFIGGPPTFKLLDFPEVQALLGRLTR